jgi:acyl carrier protein
MQITTSPLTTVARCQEKDPMLDRIRKIVNESSFLQAGTTIADCDDLYAAGLTSHASVELMLQLEDEFNIEFPERLLKRSTFESVNSLNDALAGLTA